MWLFVTNKNYLKATAYMSIAIDFVHPAMTTLHVLPAASWCTTSQNSNWFLKQTTTVTYTNSNFEMWWKWRLTLLIWSHKICNTFRIQRCQYRPKAQKNVSHTVVRICSMKNQYCFENKMGFILLKGVTITVCGQWVNMKKLYLTF